MFVGVTKDSERQRSQSNCIGVAVAMYRALPASNVCLLGQIDSVCARLAAACARFAKGERRCVASHITMLHNAALLPYTAPRNTATAFMTFLHYLRHFFPDADKTDTCHRPAPYPHRLLKTLWTTAREFARERAIPLMLNDMDTRRCHLLAKEALAFLPTRCDFFFETFDERCEW